MPTPEPTARWSEVQAQAVGENIQTLRGKLRYSADELSRVTANFGQQVPRSTIQKIETGGKKSILLHEAMMLAQALGVPLGYLLYSPYDPGKMVTTPYANNPVPAYWAADAMSPVHSFPKRGDSPNSWAVHLIQSRADRLSNLLTDGLAADRADRYIQRLESLGSTTGADRLRELQDAIREADENFEAIEEASAPLLEAHGIKVWPREIHKIPLSFYRGENPESYDPWHLHSVYQLEMELAGSFNA